MRRKYLIQIPPPLPAKLSPPKPRPTSLLDHLQALTIMAYDGEDEQAGKLRNYLNTVDTDDAVTGIYKGDMILAAVIYKDLARERGIFPDVQQAKENDIARKLQFVLRRHDTPELAWSRSARLKFLAAPTTE
jgi:hypothetical protein